MPGARLWARLTRRLDSFRSRSPGLQVRSLSWFRTSEQRKRPPLLIEPQQPVIGQSWLPSSLHTAPLALLTVITIALLSGVEFLREKSLRNQGLSFYQDTEDIPAITYLLMNIVPTAVAVVYANFWYIVDIDVKRLEPYFQMSRPGAPKSHLFLDYAFEYLFTVPYRAVKLRHWILAITSATNILVAIILPPLWNGLITTVPIDLSETISFNSFETLINSTDIELAYGGADTIPHANSVQSLGAALPAFATADYALTPFSALRSGPAYRNESWKLQTTAFAAEPECSIVPSYSRSFLSNYRVHRETHGKLVLVSNTSVEIPSLGCTMSTSSRVPLDEHNDSMSALAPMMANPSPNFPELQMDPYTTVTNFSGTCLTMDMFVSLVRVIRRPEEVSNNFTLGYIPDALGAFCNIRYFSSTGEATVFAANKSVLSYAQQTGQTYIETKDGPYGSIPFKLNLFGLDWLQANQQRATEVDNPLVLQALPLISGETLATMAYNSLSGRVALNETAWIDALQASIRLSFAVAYRNYVNQTAPTQIMTGTRVRHVFSVQVTNVIAILSEALLLVAALTSLLMIFVYRNRPNILRSDPDSITSLCSLLACSFVGKTAITESTLSMHNWSTERLVKSLQPCYNKQSTDGRAEKESQESNIRLKDVQVASATADYNFEKPDILSFLFSHHGLAASIATLAIIVLSAGSVFVDSSRRLGYDFLVDGDPFLSQLFWSFIPGLVASLLGSFWNTVLRDLSVLEPWVLLSRGYAHARRSISLRYGSRTSYTVLLDSLFFRHWLLAIVSITALSTNVLSITMGTLFLQSSTTLLKAIHVTNEYASLPLSSDWSPAEQQLNTAFNLLRTNVTDGTPVTPWTGDIYSFVPLSLPASELDSPTRYHAQSHGIGVDVSCSNFSTSTVDLYKFAWNYTLAVPDEDSPINCTIWKTWSWTDDTAPGDSLLLFAPDPFATSDPNLVYEGLQQQSSMLTANATTPTQTSTVYPSETVTPAPQQTKFIENNQFCRGNSFLIAGKFNTVPDQRSLADSPESPSEWDSRSPQSGVTTSMTGLVCKPSIRAGSFDLVVSNSGQVVSYQEVETQGSSFFSNLPDFLYNYHQSFMNATERSAKSETLVMPLDWPSLLMSRLHYKESPHTSLKDTSVQVEYVRQVYSRVFALWFSEHRDHFLAKSARPTPIAAMAETREFRMVSSIPFTVVTLILLCLYIPVVILVYVKRRNSFPGPRMPKSFGAIIPWIAHSRMLEDFKGTGHMTARQLDGYLTTLDRRYKFGWFTGRDGSRRLGLEMEQASGPTTRTTSYNGSSLEASNDARSMTTRLGAIGAVDMDRASITDSLDAISLPSSWAVSESRRTSVSSMHSRGV